MASWAKNQIAKQLARFAKNIDPNQISLKFLKGEGELNNLELDEAVLSDLLELPPWLQLTKVTCNRISAKVPWTSLKSDPIRLLLDCVEVDIIATETARQKAANVPVFTQKSSSSKPNKYGLVEKVVDGMYLSINTVTASFKSIGFKASVSISRVVVQSTTPDWRRTDNLRQTRIKDDQRGEILMFREIRWGTIRFDADASYRPESRDLPSTPLRLITNNSAVRLVIKKRLADCAMLSSKLAVVLDDILWVLTQAQLLKLSSFVHYLIKLRNQFFIPSAQQKHTPSSSPSIAPPPLQGVGQGSGLNQLFTAYDISETSIHLRTNRVDLHFCDDSTLDGGQKTGKDRRESDDMAAALQISLIGIALDHCPYHIAETKRTVLKSDNEVAIQRRQWAHQLIENFKSTDRKHVKSSPGPPSHTSSSQESSKPSRKRSTRPVLYESFFIGSLQNFYIMQVTNSKTVDHQTFLCSEKETLFLPKEMAAASVDHTTYYFMEEHVDLPVPAPNVFVQVNPIKLTFDPVTCVWLNRFAQSVISGLAWTKDFIQREPGFADHVDVRLEALLPKIVIPVGLKGEALPHKEDRPNALQLQISQAVVSNCRVGSHCSQADLLNDLPKFISCRSYADQTCFPNLSTDLSPHPNGVWLNDYSVNYQQLQNLTKRDRDLAARLQRDNNMPREVWCVWCDQMWIDFLGVEKAGGRPITFVDAVPVRLWMCQEVPYTPAEAVPLSPTRSESSLEVTASASEIGKDDCKERILPRSTHHRSDLLIGNGHVHHRSISSVDSLALSPSLQVENVPSLPRSLLSSSSVISSTSTSGADVCVYEDNQGPAADSSLCLRMSHSDSDLCARTVLEVKIGASLQDLVAPSGDYACGGPPPPYSSSSDELASGSYTGSHSSSVASLPPPYEPLQNVEDPECESEPACSLPVETHSASQAVLLCISKSLQIQLDHFQLLFLLRMMEMMSDMSCRIKEDSDLAAKDTSNCREIQREESMILNVSLPGADVDLILPPCVGIDEIQRLSFTDRVKLNKCKTDLDVSDTAIMEEEFVRANGLPVHLPRRAEIAPSESAPESLLDLCTAYPQSGDVCVPVRVTSASQITDGRSITSAIASTASVGVKELVEEKCVDLSKVEAVEACTSNSFSQPDPESCGAPEAIHQCPAGISDFDRSLHLSAQDNFEPCRTSSSTNTIQVEMVHSGVQVGSPAINGGEKPRPEDELISIVRVRAGRVLVGVSSLGDDSSVKVVADSLDLFELGNMKYGKVLDPRGSIVEAHGGAEPPIDVANAYDNTSVLRLRLESGPKAETLAPGAGDLGYAHIKVDSLNASLLMSSMDNLGQFAEDEFVLPTMPFLVELTNSCVALYDDKPRRYLSSIKMPPLQVLISDLTIHRDANGLMTLRQGAQEAASIHEQNATLSGAYTLSENEVDSAESFSEKGARSRDGTRQSGSMVSSDDTLGRHVDAVISENNRLVEDLKVLNARVTGLHGEREALLKVIDKLQQELMWSNREIDELHQRMRSVSLSSKARRSDRY